MKPSPRTLIFSEVDGVLRDPSVGSLATAANVLEELSREHVPLILCSSKTRAELEQIQQELRIRHPFVCENGGAAFIPPAYFDFAVPRAREIAGYQAVEFGRPYSDVVHTLHRTAEQLRVEIEGFSDMSVEDVARECSVTLLRARLAKLREYDEPFRILDPSPRARSRLLKALTGARLRCTTVEGYERAGAPVDKRMAMKLLWTLYKRTNGSPLTVGLANPSGEDNLLQLVDHSIVMRDDDAPHGVDVVKWAETIVDAVHEVGRHGTSSLRSQGTGQRQ